MRARLYLGCVLLALLRPALAGESPIELKAATGTLAGTLTRPEPALTAPVFVIIAGSGPTDRDGNSPLVRGSNNSLQLLAAALSASGIASVRYDKRGVGRSAAAGQAESELRFEDYVRDASAWVAQLSADARFSSVGIIGHSEGALIGTLAAQGHALSALVLIAGPGEPAPATLRRQLAGRLPPPLAARSEAILASLERGVPAAEVPPELFALYRPSVQPYLMSWFRHDPAAALAKTRSPCLIVQGDTDIQVQVADAKTLHAARPACHLAVIPGMNHVLKPVDADRGRQLASYGDPTLPLAPALIRVITDFLAHLGQAFIVERR